MFGLFKKKREYSDISIEEEVHRVVEYIDKYGGHLDSIQVEKKFIREHDYSLISRGVRDVILQGAENIRKEYGLGKQDDRIWKIISRGLNLSQAVIQKLYDIDWRF